MCDHLGRHQNGEARGRQRHLLECAVGVVGGKQAPQRQHAGQQCANPQNARCDQAQGGHFWSDPQRE